MAGSVTPWLNLVTSSYNQKPKFMAMLAATFQPLADTLDTMNQMPALFDLDAAAGVQLDTLGQWIGISRNLQIPITGIYFAWDTAGVGWDQGAWQGPGDPSSGLVVLPDAQYRTLLRAKIADNQWNGTVPGAYRIGEIIFGRNPNLAPSFVWQSNTFSNGNGWLLTNCTTTAAAAISPDGTSDAWQFQRTNITGALLQSLNAVAVPGVPWSCSISAKPGTGSFLAMRLTDFNTGEKLADAVFNVLTGVVTNLIPYTSTGVAATITQQLNGFYRCTLAATTSDTDPVNSRRAMVFSGNSNGVLVDGTDVFGNTTILVYGARLAQEVSSLPYQNDLAIIDGENMTETITVRGPPVDSLTKAIIQGGYLDLKPAGVLASYVTP